MITVDPYMFIVWSWQTLNQERDVGIVGSTYKIDWIKNCTTALRCEKNLSEKNHIQTKCMGHKQLDCCHYHYRFLCCFIIIIIIEINVVITIIIIVIIITVVIIIIVYGECLKIVHVD